MRRQYLRPARNANEVDKVVKALAGKASRPGAGRSDVADPAALKAWVEGAAAEFGGIDAIVCNVSALAVGDTAETWEKSFRTDMMHTVNSVAAALPYLEKSKSASVAIISSVSGFEVDFAAGSYGAFKAALIHYAKGLSNQLIARGIRVNSVSPGNTYFEGGIWQNIERNLPDLFKTAMGLNPTGRMGTAQEVAAGVVFLASPMAGRISRPICHRQRYQGGVTRERIGPTGSTATRQWAPNPPLHLIVSPRCRVCRFTAHARGVVPGRLGRRRGKARSDRNIATMDRKTTSQHDDG